MGGVGGDGGNGDAQLFCGNEIDVVGAGAEGRDQPSAVFGQNLQTRAIHAVIHKDQNGAVAGTQRGGVGRQFSFEKLEVMSVGILLAKAGFKISTRAENQRIHSLRLWVGRQECENAE